VIGPTCWNHRSAASQTADDAECRRQCSQQVLVRLNFLQNEIFAANMDFVFVCKTAVFV